MIEAAPDRRRKHSAKSQNSRSDMPWWKQRTTVFAADTLGGSRRIRGKFVLPDLDTVEDESFWQAHGNAKCVVCCFRDCDVKYPDNAAISQICIVDPRSKHERGPSFDAAVPVVKRTLESGHDVVVHCRQSYHRGPLVCAVLMQAICGVDYQVVLHICVFLGTRSGLQC
jgi:hypothetical protein